MTEVGAKEVTGIDSLKEASRGFFFPTSKGGEDRLLLGLLAASTVIHLGVILLGDFSWLRDKPPFLQEEPIGIDLTEFDVGGRAALPKAIPAEEAKVQEQLLPQLPKKFSVKEETKPEESIAEQKEEVKPEEAKPAEEPVKAEPTKIKTDNKEDNQMDDAQIRKRAALEALRREEKTAKTNEAPEEDPLARIAAELNKSSKKGGALGSLTGKARVNKYVAYVQKAIKQNYNLPEVYNLKGSSVQVTIEMTVGAHGELTGIEIAKPSGDPAFDEMTIQAVRASVPFEKPPVDLVGSPISLLFTP